VNIIHIAFLSCKKQVNAFRYVAKRTKHLYQPHKFSVQSLTLKPIMRLKKGWLQLARYQFQTYVTPYTKPIYYKTLNPNNNIYINYKKTERGPSRTRWYSNSYLWRIHYACLSRKKSPTII